MSPIHPRAPVKPKTYCTADWTFLNHNPGHCVRQIKHMTFQHRLFFVINEGNGLSLHLIPSCTMSCCACIKLSDVPFGGESQEKSRRVGMNERHHGRKTDRQRNDRRHFPQSESWKTPKHADRQSGVSDDRACPAVPPALRDSLLNFYWIWNVKRWGTYSLSFFSLFFPLPLVSLSLSVVKYVTQQEPSFRQLMQTRLISWC